MTEVSSILTVPHQQDVPALTQEEDPLPSLPNFDDIIRAFGSRSTYGARTASVFSSDSGERHVQPPSNAGRIRRLSTATTTSLGRPRYLATRSKRAHKSKDDITFRRDIRTKELAAFLWTNSPPPQNWMSVPEESHTTQKKRWYRRRKTIIAEKPVLQLPDCAVAAKTPTGHWHIAIHIPAANAPEDDYVQPRAGKTKDSDVMSIISKRFLGATLTNKMNSLRRSYSTNTLNTVNDDETPKKLTKNAPPLPSLPRNINATSFPSTTEKAAATEVTTTELKLGQSLLSNTQEGGIKSTSDVSNEHSEDNHMDEQSPVVSRETKQTYRQSLITDFVPQTRPTTSTSMDPMHGAAADTGTQPFSDCTQSNNLQETVPSVASPPPTDSTPPSTTKSVVTTPAVSAQSISFQKARNVALHALEQAQREEKEAKAVVSRAEQNSRDTIPALESSTNMARTILQEAKLLAAKAMENADVEAAVAAAKQAAEAQAAILTAERQISSSRIKLDMLLSAANARLAELKITEQSATRVLRIIAAAEAKAEQQRLESEKREQERIATEEKAALERLAKERADALANSERLAKERAEALAAAEAEAIAEVRAAFAIPKQGAATNAGPESESEALNLERTNTGAETTPTASVSVPSVTRDPEATEIAKRLRKMDDLNQVMLQTLSAVVRMGNGFEETTKILALGRNNNGIGSL